MKTRKLCVLGGVFVACLALFAETPDKFIRYVEATGQQAVDTGIVGRYGMRAEMQVEWMAVGGDTAFLDARGDDGTSENNTRVMFCHNGGAAPVGVAYGAFQYGKRNGTTCTWETDRIYSMTTDFTVTNDTEVWCQSWVDGYQVWNEVKPGLIDTGYNLYIFACNLHGQTMYMSKSRCYGLKLWQDDANGVRHLVRDFRPCLKDGRVGLYDAVSETIFYSFTGTDLAYDMNDDVPDEYVEYVESHGDTYVDTGVIGRSGTSCEADVEWLALGGDYALLNARGTRDGNDRFFLIHSNDGGMATGYGGYNGNYGHKYTVDARYVIQSDLRAGSQTLVVNGETVYSGTSSATIDTGRNLYLFGNNRAGAVENCSHVRLYGLKIWQDGTLVRDLRPCRKRGVPALYDDVEKVILYPKLKKLTCPNLWTAEGRPDYFVEYLRGNGTVCLDTGVRGRAGTRAAGEYAWTQMRTRAEEDYKYLEGTHSRLERTYLGAVNGENRFYMIHENDKYAWSGYGTQRVYLERITTNHVEEVVTNLDETVTTNLVEVVSTNRITLAAGHKYAFDVSYDAGSQTIDLDGERIMEKDSAVAVDSDCNLYLFAVNGNGSSFYESPTRCYWLKLWQDGTLVRDFKPCVKDGKGMLWDEVSQTLFRPIPDIPATDENTGAFLGFGEVEPAAFLEYVETDRKQYVDTEVVGRSGTTAEFEMAWTADGSDESFLGMRDTSKADSLSRFYFWQKNSTATLASAIYYGYGYTKYLIADAPDQVGSNQSANLIPVTAGQVYHVRSSLNTGSQTIEVDGTTLLNRTESATISSDLHLYLFALNYGGTAQYFGRTRFYWLKIWQDGQLVRNFRPILLESGLAALWDSVSKQVFLPSAPFSAMGPVSGEFEIRSGTTILIR